MSRGRGPGVPRGPPLDPGVHRPSRCAAPTLDRLVEAACLAPAPHHSRPWRWVVIDTAEGKRALADGMGARWRADLERRRRARRQRIDELVEASHAKLDRRAGARARLPHVGRPRPLSRRRPPARRVGHGPALARRGGREPHARGGRRRTRVVLGRGADLLPRGGPRRARPPGRVAARTRWSSSATPIPRTRPAPRPPVPLDELRALPLMRVGGRRVDGWRGTTRACGEPVVEVGPRLPAEVDRGTRRGRAPSARARRRAPRVARPARRSRRAAPSRRRARWTLVSTPVPMLMRSPPPFSDGAHERVDDVVDEDEVAGLLAVAEDRRPVAGRAACRRRSRRRRPRRAGPGAGRRRWRARAPCTRGRGSRGSSGGSRPTAFFDTPYGDTGCCGWPSRDRQRLGHAVERAAGAGEHHLARAGRQRALQTLSEPRMFTSASNVGRATDTRTSACAARWKITSGLRCAIRSATPGERMSRRWNVNCGDRAAAARRRGWRASRSRGRRRRRRRSPRRAAGRRASSR